MTRAETWKSKLESLIGEIKSDAIERTVETEQGIIFIFSDGSALGGLNKALKTYPPGDAFVTTNLGIR
jgi:hypothetical protein